MWYDTNQNGQQDADEPGVNGITAELYDNATCTGVATDSTTTANGGVPAADGFYQFTGLDSGDYCVAFTGLPPGYQITVQNTGPDTSDSDADPVTGQIQNINLTADDPTNDAGLIALVGSINGLVYCDDSPNNGTVDSGEEVSGVNINLYTDDDCDGTGDNLYASMLTITDGTFLFDQLPVGLAPVPPNAPLCYVATFDSQDPALAECNVPITPEEEGRELDTDDPNGPPVTFGVEVLRMVPVNTWFALLGLILGVVFLTRRQFR